MAISVLTRTQDLLSRWLAWIVPSSEPIGTVGWWRDRMLGAMLLAYAVFGTLLIVPNVQLALRVGVYQVVAVDAAVYAILIGAVFARRAPRAPRAWIIIVITLSLGVFFSWGWGGNAAGPLWLIAAPIIAGILLGVQAAVMTLGVVGVITVAIGVAVSQGLPPWTHPLSPDAGLPNTAGQWLIIGSNLLFLATVGALGTAILTWGLALQTVARKRAEDELLLIGQALEQSEDVVLLLDAEGRIAHRNRVAPDGLVETAGNDLAGSLAARTIDALELYIADGSRAPLPWRTAFDGAAWMGRCERTTQGERQHVIVTVTPVKDASGVVSRALVVLRDITREESLEERLRVAAKLEAVGTMASGIAHDFNNLLQPILTSAEEIRQLVPAGHPAVTHAVDIEASAARGRGLVRRILTFTRDVEMPRVPTALAAVCDEAVRLTERLRPAAVTLETAFDRTAWVMADPSELHHVVVNLITNACDAMPRGGALRLVVQRDGDRARLVVSDSGVGMDETTRSRMFLPFFSTKGPGRGSGLGLATVHGTITALGGTIDVLSAAGQGTTISIHLPAITPPAQSVDAAVPSRTERDVDRRTVLLVDDDEAVRRSIVRMLTRLGYQVVDYADPRDALARLGRTPPAADVLLTDLSMPNLSGIELASQIRARAASLPIVLMTGMVDTEHADAARASGVSAVVQKPFSQGELRAALDAAMRSAAVPATSPALPATPPG
jgi:signal transduction histidine kinase/ActR/RegA family two-component response regulator